MYTSYEKKIYLNIYKNKVFIFLSFYSKQNDNASKMKDITGCESECEFHDEKDNLNSMTKE